MSGLNKVMLIGHLGRDPEIRRTQAGDPIANFSIATSETWKDKNTGERKERTEWHNIVIFNEGLAKVAESYLRKGSKVYVEGQMATRKWTDKDGQDRWTTEVVLQRFGGSLVLLDKAERGPPQAGGADDYGQTTTRERSSGLPEAPRSSGNPLDDDIPF